MITTGVSYPPRSRLDRFKDTFSSYWRLIPWWGRAIISLVCMAILIKFPGYILLGLFAFVFLILTAIIKTPVIAVVGMVYRFDGAQRPEELVILDWLTKPLRIADSVIDIVELAWEDFFKK